MFMKINVLSENCWTNVILPHGRGHVGMHWNFSAFLNVPPPFPSKRGTDGSCGQDGHGEIDLRSVQE